MPNKFYETTAGITSGALLFSEKVFLVKSSRDWRFLEKFTYLCRVIQNRNSTLVDI